MYVDNGGTIQFGCILYYVLYGKCTLAVVRDFKCSLSCKDHFNLTFTFLDSLSKKFIMPVVDTSTISVIHCDRILEKCVFIDVGESKYMQIF